MGKQGSKGAKAKQTMPPQRKNAKNQASKGSQAQNAQAKKAARTNVVAADDAANEAYNRLIIVGSTRVNGRSAALAQQIFDTCLEEYPDDAVTIASVASLSIDPCIGCNACRKGDCALDDDMRQVLELVEAADEVIVVSPVYFAGPPAAFKALLDRLQPFFWTDARHQETRPLTLHIIGEGHDPFGYDPLVTCVSSAFYCAGFVLDQILDWVGKIDASGEIMDEPDVFVLGDGDEDDFDVDDDFDDDFDDFDDEDDFDADADDDDFDDDDDADDDEDFVDVDRDGLPDSEELKEF